MLNSQRRQTNECLRLSGKSTLYDVVVGLFEHETGFETVVGHVHVEKAEELEEETPSFSAFVDSMSFVSIKREK